VISVDSNNQDGPQPVAQLAQKLKLTHRILVGGGKASDLYDVEQVLPTTFWIDHRGLVVQRETGFRPEMEKEIERMIEELLKRRAAPANPGQGSSSTGGAR
jgi:hypothetical protein